MTAIILSMNSPEPRSFEPARGPAPRPAAAVALPDWSATSFTASDGREIRVSFRLERVFSLRSFAGAVLRIHPAPSAGGAPDPNWRAHMSFEDVLRVDLATLEVLAPLRAAMDAEKLIAPLSLESLLSRQGQEKVLKRLAGERGPMPIVEIVSVEGGAPREMLGEAGAALGACAKGVIVRVEPSWPRLDVPALLGLSLDCSRFDDEGSLLGALWGFARSARAAGVRSLALGLCSQSCFELAAGVGISHASVREPPAALRPAAQARAGLETHAA